MAGERTLIGSSIPPFRLVFFMWLIFTLERFFHVDLNFLGINPRTLLGLVGIVLAPLLHGNIIHLISNTIPLLFLGAVLFFYYHRIAPQVFLRCYFLTNILVWLFARPNVHIGASGLIYGIASFLIFFGVFRRDLRSLIISIIVMILYGGIFYGALPTNPLVSWESHLFGALVGLWSALSFRSKRV